MTARRWQDRHAHMTIGDHVRGGRESSGSKSRHSWSVSSRLSSGDTSCISSSTSRTSPTSPISCVSTDVFRVVAPSRQCFRRNKQSNMTDTKKHVHPMIIITRIPPDATRMLQGEASLLVRVPCHKHKSTLSVSTRRMQENEGVE